MIDFDDYRFSSEAELKGFLEKIPGRLSALAQTLGDWDGNKYNFEKKNGNYSPFALSYELIRVLEKWVLETSKKTKELPKEQIMQLCSLLGEIVVAKTRGGWQLDESELDFEGDENECRLIPSVSGWSDDSDDLPFTPLFTIEHFLRTREANYLEMSIRYYVEEDDERFEIISEVGDDEIDSFLDDEFDLEEVMSIIEIRMDQFSTVLRKQGIDFNVERDENGYYVDNQIFSDEKLEEIESFYQQYSVRDNNEEDEITDMMSAYLAELCSFKKEGFFDYVNGKLVVTWSQSPTKTGQLFILDILKRIKEFGPGSTRFMMENN